MQRQVQGCIRGGAHGIAVLGLATEVSKLSETERYQLLDWVAEDIGGRLPLAVTVYGNSVRQQSDFVRAAQAAGANWVILQPPLTKGLPEIEYVRFFGTIADTTDLPVAIQNAPDYLGVGLSAAGLNTLHRNHENFTLLKGEGPALAIRQVIEETQGKLAVFNGRGGLELPDNLRAGCAGLIPAPECFDRQVEIYHLMQSDKPEDEAEAERLYREILPLIVFVMQSVETFLCYGKRVTARRLGVEQVYDRAPAVRPNRFGLECIERYAAFLGAM
jgi:4-hydroxy-tetrahydrodipicolinate synthase